MRQITLNEASEISKVLFDEWYTVQDILIGNTIEMHKAVTDYILEHDKVQVNGFTGFQYDLLSYLGAEARMENSPEDFEEIVTDLETRIKAMTSLECFNELQEALK